MRELKSCSVKLTTSNTLNDPSKTLKRKIPSNRQSLKQTASQSG